ncbi:MAG: phospho-sugar mutase [Lactobacillaceae bacterium]|jgi:phosphoglucomutase|nr:phospho-sugar mutase [Lactobacillaceae bacterium]
MDTQLRYQEWLNNPAFDEDIKAELRKIEADQSEIDDRFYKDLEFGTGGLRAVVGAGTNRLNRYTVRRITAGYADFLVQQYGHDAQVRGVVIAHDMRHGSQEFTLEAARVFAAKGIATYLFKGIAPTPELSFAVPYLNAIGGVVITASHNPAIYNGYKIYDATGGQAVPSLAEPVIAEINKLTDYAAIPLASADDTLIHWLDDTVDTAFIAAQKTNLRQPVMLQEMGKQIKIVYTPLHGSGKRMILKGLQNAGFKHVYTVESQLVEDPEFKTVKSPNPEDPEALTMALEVAKQKDADLIMGSDPDADRVGVLVKTGEGVYTPLTGNQVGSLLVYYLLANDADLADKKAPFIANTIVTSELGAKIAESFGVETVSTLTGFKYIGEQINLLQDEHDFIMGYEESYGYLIGTLARDKDAVGSAMLIAEMTAYYLREGKTLVDQLNNIFKEYGYYQEKLVSRTLKGQDGMAEIQRLMHVYRGLPAAELTAFGIESVKDYATGIDGLPQSDVVKFFFANGSWIAVRPSGTEPKIKFYLGAKGETQQVSDDNMALLQKFIVR